MAAVKISPTPFPSIEYLSPSSARTSAATILASNILSRKPSVTISVRISHETRNRTLSYGRSEEIDRASSDSVISITQCLYKCGDNVRVNYIVSKALCQCFGMNIPRERWSAPWAMAAVKISATLLLMPESSLLSARPSAATISVSNILFRMASAKISLSIELSQKMLACYETMYDIP